jgi:hypothetical protein
MSNGIVKYSKVGGGSVPPNTYVPYIGATQNVDLGDFGVIEAYNQLIPSPPAVPAGQGVMYYNEARGGVSAELNEGVTSNLATDNLYYVVNGSVSTITKGTPVMFKGVDIHTGLTTVTPMDASGVYPVVYFMGVAANDISSGGGLGYVQVLGYMTGLDLSTFNNGDILYCDPSVVGGFTKTKPVSPYAVVTCALVVDNDSTDGIMLIRPTFLGYLSDIQDTQLSKLADGDLLQYFSSTKTWKNIPVNTIIKRFYTAINGATVTGTTALTLSSLQEIPANTFLTGDIVRINSRAIKGSTLGNTTLSIYVNTTNTLVGASLLGIYTANTRSMGIKRDLYIKNGGSSTEVFPVGTSLSTDDTSTANAPSTVAVNWGVTQYIIFAIQNASTSDSTVVSGFTIDEV